MTSTIFIFSIILFSSLLVYWIGLLIIQRIYLYRYNAVRSSGRGICSVCKKTIDGNIWELPGKGDKKYYCRSHAYKTLKSRYGMSKSPTTYDHTNTECAKCGKRLEKLRHTQFHCSNCHLDYCTEHLESHNCIEMKLASGQNLTLKDYKSLNPFENVCQYCNSKCAYIDSFFCKYCLKWHCSEHRIPEDHECTGSPTNPHKGAGRIIYSKGRTRYEAE